jgi:hypothetical protein
MSTQPGNRGSFACERGSGGVFPGDGVFLFATYSSQFLAPCGAIGIGGESGEGQSASLQIVRGDRTTSRRRSRVFGCFLS